MGAPALSQPQNTIMLGPSAVSPSDYSIAQKPGFGIEKTVFVSREHAIEIGMYEILGANSGVFTPDPVNAPAATGQELIAVVDSETGMDGGIANVVLTIVGTNPALGVATLTASFAPPGYARDNSKMFQVGYAAECIEGAGALVKTVTSATVSCSASAAGARIKLFAMPALASFKQIGCATDLRWSSKSSTPVSIACGRDASAFVKPGRSSPSSLALGGKLFGLGEGLAKYDGVTATYLVKFIKEAKVHTDSLFFIEAALKVTPDVPDEGEVTISGDGLFEDVAYLVAR